MKAQYFLFAAVLFSLGACGGGGGTDGGSQGGGASEPSPSIQLTQSNGAQVAATAMEADTAAESGYGLSPLSVGSDTANASTSIAGVTRAIVNLIKPGNQISTQVHEDYCDTGSITAPHDTSVGTITFNNCEVADMYFNGSVDFSVSETTISLTYRNFTISTVSELLATFNGDLLVQDISTASADALRLSGSAFLFESADDNVAMYSFVLEVSIDGSGNVTESFTYTVESNLLGGTVKVTTSPGEGGAPLQYYAGDDYPYSGAVVVIGASNSRVRISAQGSGEPSAAILIEFDQNGDGFYEAVLTPSINWSQFDQLSDFVNSL